jgi:hypothetical protein
MQNRLYQPDLNAMDLAGPSWTTNQEEQTI